MLPNTLARGRDATFLLLSVKNLVISPNKVIVNKRLESVEENGCIDEIGNQMS